jgi:outer membrane autotransporter protein
MNVGLDFGVGENVLENAGTITGGGVFVGLETITNSGSMNLYAAPDLRTLNNSGTLGLLNELLSTPQLETFNNSGVMVFSGNESTTPNRNDFGLATGRWLMPGADFIASEGSRVIMHAFLDAGFQDVCETVGPSGRSQADCINLSGGSTSGVTQITLTGYLPADGGAYAEKGVALIDVSGGVSHDSDFVLDPASPNFDPDALFGGGIRASELFTYHLFYDASTQVHRLVGIPDPAFMTLGVLTSAAQSLWRTGDEAGSARQSELRFAKSDAAGGLWFKAADGRGKHDAQTRVELFGRSEAVQARYEQRDRAYTFGADIVGTEGDSGYSLGISVGDISSTVDFDASPTRAELSGVAVNVYGSYRKGPFFLDLSGGGYSGDLEGRFSVGSSDTALETSVSAFGARTEAGWRLSLGKALSLEPLASVVYVRSGLSDIQHLPGSNKNALQFDPGNSLRGGLGARATVDSVLAGVRLGLSLAGRVWWEFEGEANAYVRTGVDALPFSSTFDGTFSEASAALDISSAGGAVSGYLSFGGRFGDDYDNTTASLGIRYNW